MVQIGMEIEGYTILGAVITDAGTTIVGAKAGARFVVATAIKGRVWTLLDPRHFNGKSEAFAAFAASAGDPEMVECPACKGYGHIDDKRGRPSLDGRNRKCLDCRGEGKVPAKETP
jgi:hypothetical protein